jgi:actin related protein 2/3 complex subunit 2
MILLEFGNKIIVNTLTARFNPDNKPESVDITVADFDGVLFHVSTLDGNKGRIVVSISMKCFRELQEYGVDDVLKRIYGDLICETEAGHDFSIAFDLDALPENPDQWIIEASMMKRHCLAAPFERCFEMQEAGSESSKPMVIPYRDNETIYLKADKDRVTVIFSTVFNDDDDIVIGKVFLQEFVDARRNVQQAPQVLFSHREPPAELEGTTAARGKNIGYITFVMSPRHYRAAVREQAISLVQTFRDYLHYHIKCSKAYLHSRMRARVTMLLKILNRARPEEKNVTKKTMTGKTFKRK